MPEHLLKKVRQDIDRYHMLDAGDGVIVAVSGGPDSIALLDVLALLSEEYRLKLFVAHLNHGLRPGPAEEEEAFVRQISRHYGLICESRKTDVASLSRQRRCSIEETARKERYLFLEEVRIQYHAGKIALGHHTRDQAETVLMNLLRGSGREGLRGMQHVRDRIFIRPLLGVTPALISEYLSSRSLSYRTDLSNTDEHYLRNRIRQQLLPELQANYNPRIESTLCRTAEILDREEDYLRATVEEVLADGRTVRVDAELQQTSVSIPAFLALHEALQFRLMKRLLLEHTREKQGIEHVHICDVRSLFQSPQPGAVMHLPFGMEARREYDQLVIGRRLRPPRLSRWPHQNQREAKAGFAGADMVMNDIRIPGRVRLDAQKIELSLDFVDRSAVRFDDRGTVFMDYDCIRKPLILRTVRPGDIIQPLGMSGMKKLKSHFIDRKVPVRLRTRIPLLIDDDSVIWVVGQMLSERVKVTDRTERILRIRMTETI
jgi:tRNA(Ile)-lysidine synthase